MPGVGPGGGVVCGATHAVLVEPLLLPVPGGMPGMPVVLGGRCAVLRLLVLVLLLVCVTPWSCVTTGVDSMVGMDIAADIIVLSRVCMT